MFRLGYLGIDFFLVVLGYLAGLSSQRFLLNNHRHLWPLIIFSGLTGLPMQWFTMFASLEEKDAYKNPYNQGEKQTDQLDADMADYEAPEDDITQNGTGTGNGNGSEEDSPREYHHRAAGSTEETARISRTMAAKVAAGSSPARPRRTRRTRAEAIAEPVTEAAPAKPRRTRRKPQDATAQTETFQAETPAAAKPRQVRRKPATARSKAAATPGPADAEPVDTPAAGAKETTRSTADGGEASEYHHA